MIHFHMRQFYYAHRARQGYRKSFVSHMQCWLIALIAKTICQRPSYSPLPQSTGLMVYWLCSVQHSNILESLQRTQFLRTHFLIWSKNIRCCKKISNLLTLYYTKRGLFWSNRIIQKILHSYLLIDFVNFIDIEYLFNISLWKIC